MVKLHPMLIQKNVVLWIRHPEKVEQQVPPPIKTLMLTYYNGVKQAVVKGNILECVRIGKTLMLRIQANKWKENVLKRKRLK